MLGNDVVDLRDPEARPAARHPRFDARVFGASERAALEASAAPERLRWVLWAAKEAAYKALRQRDPCLGFSPRRFQVRLAGAALRRGQVRCGDARLAISIGAGAELVHVVAHEPERAGPELVSGVVRLGRGEDASRAVRAAALRALAPRLGVPPDRLRFVREERRPLLLLRGAPAPLDVSLSHHGRFAAFVLAPRPAAGAAEAGGAGGWDALRSAA